MINRKNSKHITGLSSELHGKIKLLACKENKTILQYLKELITKEEKMQHEEKEGELIAC